MLSGQCYEAEVGKSLMKDLRLHLTEAHVARVHRVLPDPGVPVGQPLHDDADYAAWLARILAAHPAPGALTWLFAYGSLIWKPGVVHVAEQPGVAHGWHRRFCITMPRFRGTPESPGLMMALDRGGQCAGMLFALPWQGLSAQLDALFRREFTFKPANSMPRWIRVQTPQGPVVALSFVMNRASPMYAGALPLKVVADRLAHACGHWGSGAEYLRNTVMHLEARGVHDRNLWRLQRLVAARIDAMAEPAP